MKWTKEEHNRLIELKQNNLPWQRIAETMTAEFEKRFTKESCRSRWRHERHKIKEEPTYKETIEIKPDGSHYSDKLITMSEEQSKDVNYLLKAHGYDVNEWELVSARSNIWHTYSKQDGQGVSYASKITVKPKQETFNWNEFIKQVQNVPKIKKEPKYISTPNEYLNIPLFDMHFGIGNYSYYKPTQTRILHHLDKNYKEILFYIGSDLFHHNDHRNRTASGREIEQTDMTKAWKDATLFYELIINKAIKQSRQVTIKYIKGNHDESLSWAFVKYLEARYPQITFDTTFKERKVHMLGNNFIGANHGDKKKEQNLAENFATEFPIEWSKATTREILVGHLHTERVLDKSGIIIRRLPTGVHADKWHDDMGYTTAHKRFQIFEYNQDRLETIHYV